MKEQDKQKLDSIVKQMLANKESDQNIQMVVNDFKQKYSKQATQPVQQDEPGLFQSIVRNIANPALKIASSVRSIPGIITSPTKSGADEAMTKEYDYGYLGKATPIQNPLEALGTGIQAGLTVATGAGSSVAKGLGLTGAKAFGARVLEGAALGGSFQVGSNLANSKSATEGVGLSTVLGGLIPGVGQVGSKLKTAVLSKAAPTAENIINSLIKPLQKDFAYGKNPAQGILREGIVANNFDDLSQKVVGKISEVGGKIGALGETLDQSGKISLDLTPALRPIDDAIAVAAKSNNKTLFQSLQNVKTALIYDLKVGADEAGTPAIVQGEAKNLLTAGYKTAKDFLTDIAEHTRFTGNPSDDKALNMATKRAYGIVRQLMNEGADSVDPKLGNEIRSLNERYGDLLSARNAINHRDIVLKRQNFLSLADKFAIPVSIASSLMTGVASGDWSKAGLALAAQLGSVAAVKGLGSTASKTRIAKFLSALSPEERIGILNSTPVLKNYWERITGQTVPTDPNAPRTRVLQSVDDYIKNPKLGLSFDNVTKKISSAEKGTIRDFTDAINGAYKPDSKTLANLKRDAQEIATKYGFDSAMKSDKALAKQFGEYLDSTGFDKKIKK